MPPKDIIPPVALVLPQLPDHQTVIALNCDAVVGPSGPVPLSDVTHMTLAELTAEVLKCLQPDLIILPLFSADYDATSAIETLLELGYTGRVTVLAPQLPNPRLVERELRGLGLPLTLISP